MTVVYAVPASPDLDGARVAARLARALGQPLLLAHAVGDADAATARAMLTNLAAALAGEGVPIERELLGWPTHDVLAAAAERRVAKLLVVGYGSEGQLAEKLVRNARVPVLALRDAGALAQALGGSRALGVLVGTDRGTTARAAEDLARELVAAVGADLTLAQVVDPRRVHERLGLASPPADHSIAPDAREWLEAQIAARPGERVAVLAGRSAPEARLVDFADDQEADLLVVGARRRSWLEERWYGSVSRAVLRAAPTSVLCVPPPLVRTIPNITRRGRVLAATDLSALGDVAIAHAVCLLHRGDSLHVVHVIEPVPDPPAPDRVQTQRSAQRIRDLVARAPGTPKGLDLHVHVEIGPRAATILRIAEREDVDVVVLGAHGRSGIASAPIGAIALQVIARAKRPVVLVPAPPE